MALRTARSVARARRFTRRPHQIRARIFNSGEVLDNVELMKQWDGAPVGLITRKVDELTVVDMSLVADLASPMGAMADNIATEAGEKIPSILTKLGNKKVAISEAQSVLNRLMDARAELRRHAEILLYEFASNEGQALGRVNPRLLRSMEEASDAIQSTGEVLYQAEAILLKWDSGEITNVSEIIAALKQVQTHATAMEEAVAVLEETALALERTQTRTMNSVLAAPLALGLKNEEDKPYPIVETVGGAVLGVVDAVEEVIADGASIGPCITSGFTICDAGHKGTALESEIIEKTVVPILTSETAAPVVDPLIGGLGKASDGIDRSLTVGIKGMESAGGAVVNAFTPRGGTINSALARIEKAKAQGKQKAIVNSGVVKDNGKVWSLVEVAGRKAVSEKEAGAPEVEGQNFISIDNFTSNITDVASQSMSSMMP
ncbi:MAG: hypothetical protein R3F23_05375 [Verrucomicrobiia bacterium]